MPIPSPPPKGYSSKTASFSANIETTGGELHARRQHRQTDSFPPGSKPLDPGRTGKPRGAKRFLYRHARKRRKASQADYFSSYCQHMKGQRRRTTGRGTGYRLHRNGDKIYRANRPSPQRGAATDLSGSRYHAPPCGEKGFRQEVKYEIIAGGRSISPPAFF